MVREKEPWALPDAAAKQRPVANERWTGEGEKISGTMLLSGVALNILFFSGAPPAVDRWRGPGEGSELMIILGSQALI